MFYQLNQAKYALKPSLIKNLKVKKKIDSISEELLSILKLLNE